MKTRIIGLRVNEEEADLLLRAAYSDNRTLSGYIRHTVLERAKYDLEENEEE